MRTTYRVLYRLGVTPWDSDAVPAPVIALTEGPGALPPGHAVDLGCGTGRQARYLAARGWTVTAVDAAPEALAAARAREGLAESTTHRVQWRRADVTEQRQVDPDGRLAGAVTLLLDNGCLHGIPDARRPGWAATVHALAAPGCVLLVRAAPRGHRGVGPRGLRVHELSALLGQGWRCEQMPEPHWVRAVRLADVSADVSTGPRSSGSALPGNWLRMRSRVDATPPAVPPIASTMRHGTPDSAPGRTPPGETRRSCWEREAARRSTS
jgi:SAM-dependent methyltransferase